MHLLRMMERWAAPEPHLDRRQTTAKTTAQATTGSPPSVVSTVVDSVTSAAPTTTQQDTEAPTTSTQQPATTIVKTSDQQTTSTTPQTTQQTKTTQQPTTSSSQPTTKAQTSQTSQSAVTTVITPTVSDGSAPSTTSIDAFTGTPTSKSSNADSGGFNGVKGKDIATGVGVVVGVVGGFAIIVIGIYMWRRHQRRRQMERIGSMEELPRPPSPGPLSRNFTRGHGPRQPIDDDDDDFLTPMDTLPNTHRMDEMGTKSPTNDTALFDDKSVYAESIYPNDDNEPSLPPMFPVAPPAAVTAANGRYYSGDFSSMRPKTPQSAGLGAGGPNTGAIPTYSAMNKYAAYTPGAAVTTPVGAAITTNTSTPSPANSRTSTSRPGGGYRSYDSHDAGGYV